ncbi:MAG: hypothetical protein R2811_00730 [Flavobacteriales bacterium]
MDVTIGTDNGEVLASGSVIAFDNESIRFRLDDLLIRFELKNDSESKEQNIKYVKEGDKELLVTLVNFDNPLGTGNYNPIKVGTLRSKDLYLNFIVHALGTKKIGHMLSYTWYLRPPSQAPNGE